MNVFHSVLVVGCIVVGSLGCGRGTTPRVIDTSAATSSMTPEQIQAEADAELPTD